MASFDGNKDDLNVKKALLELQKFSNKIELIGSEIVPWFPTQIEDFDQIGKRILSEGDGI